MDSNMITRPPSLSLLDLQIDTEKLSKEKPGTYLKDDAQDFEEMLSSFESPADEEHMTDQLGYSLSIMSILVFLIAILIAVPVILLILSKLFS